MLSSWVSFGMSAAPFTYLPTGTARIYCSAVVTPFNVSWSTNQSIYRRGCKVIEDYRETARIFPQQCEKMNMQKDRSPAAQPPFLAPSSFFSSSDENQQSLLCFNGGGGSLFSLSLSLSLSLSPLECFVRTEETESERRKNHYEGAR